MKVCTRCKVEKGLDLFSTRQKSADGKASWCKECFKQNWSARYRKNHAHYRDRHNESRGKIREANARRVFEYLETHPCVTCGETDPIVLEFDHRGEDDKIDSVSNLIRNASWRRIEIELEKCDVLCANCHRRKSAAQFKYKRHVFLNI